jgi:hypothetical protein
MEAFNDFWAKFKNSWRSGTMWFGATVMLMGGGLKALEWAQVEVLPQITPLINPTFGAWLSFAVGMGIWYFRFKTIVSLAQRA